MRLNKSLQICKGITYARVAQGSSASTSPVLSLGSNYVSGLSFHQAETNLSSKFGTCFFLDNSNGLNHYVATSLPTFASSTGAYTHVQWQRRLSSSAAVNTRFFAVMSNSLLGFYFSCYSLSDGNLEYVVNLQTGQYAVYDFPFQDPPIGDWFFFAIVQRKLMTSLNDADVYINGRKYAFTVGPTYNAFSPSDSQILMYQYGASNEGSSELGPSYSWNRALSQSEIMSLYADPWLPLRTPRPILAAKYEPFPKKGGRLNTPNPMGGKVKPR